MAIKRPAIYEHNNSNLPIVDSDFVKGGIRSAVQTLSDLYALTTKASQLKQHSTQIYVSGESKFYVLKDVSNIGNSNGWQEVNFGDGGALGTNVVYTSGTQTISGAKNFTTRPTFNNINLITTGDLVNLELNIEGLGNIVYTTGDQTISGNKNFISRPTVNGTGILTFADTGNFNITVTANLTGENLVYTTGDQTISGVKTFQERLVAPEIWGTGLFGSNRKIDLQSGRLYAGIISLDYWNRILSGQWKTNQKLLVNDTAVLLSGEAVESNGTINNMIKLTQAQYNALSPKNPTTFYVIVG